MDQHRSPMDQFRSQIEEWYNNLSGIHRPLTQEEWQDLELRLHVHGEGGLEWIRRSFDLLPHVAKEWNHMLLHGFARRAHVENRLAFSPPGHFLLRWSDTQPGSLAITVVRVVPERQQNEISSILITTNVGAPGEENSGPFFLYGTDSYRTLSNCVLALDLCDQWVNSQQAIRKQEVFTWTA